MTTTSFNLSSGGCVDCWGTSASRPLEYTGMIIKITRSTSRISINGTTFMSETIPRLPPTDIPIIHLVSGKCPARRTLTTCEKLLARFELGGNQTNLVNAGAAHDVDGTGDVHEQYIVVAFDESNFLGALLEDLLHARAKTIPGGVLVVDLEFAVVGNLDDHGLVFELDVLLLVRRGLRNERIQAPRRERGDDNENNDQHEQNIDQRHHIG